MSQVLEMILNSKKHKYVVLDELLEPYLSKEENVNIFIDVYSVLNQLYNPHTIERFNSLSTREKYILSSELLNMAGHYRHYFWSRHYKYTTIYFFYSNKPCTKKININPNYRSDFYSKRIEDNPAYFNINNLVQKNLKILEQVLGDYIPHCYFLNTGNIDPNIVPYHIIKNFADEDDLNITLTNDEVNYQHVLNHLTKSIILTCRSDDSKVIDRDNLISNLGSSKDRKRLEGDVNFIPEFAPYVLSTAGNKHYIEGIKRYGIIRSVKMINKLIKKEHLSNVKYLDEKMFTEAVKESNVNIKEKDLKQIEENYKCISLDYLDILYNVSDLTKIENKIVDKISAKSLRYINETYYARYPIILEYLVEGEEYE